MKTVFFALSLFLVSGFFSVLTAQVGTGTVRDVESPVQQVDINTADAVTLAEGLPGIGPAKAARIVQWRLEHGVFSRVEDLQQVKGIGVKTIEKLRAYVLIGNKSAADRRQNSMRETENEQARVHVQTVLRSMRAAAQPEALAKRPVRAWYRKSALELLSLR